MKDDICLGTFTYTGRPIELPITFKIEGVPLLEGRDYKVRYRDNIEEGIATVIFTGIGEYSGEIYRTFKIVRLP